MMIDEFKEVYRNSIDLQRRLSFSMQKLGVMASKIYGEELVADMCNGNEVEFRHVVEGEGFVDDFDCIRVEDVINRYEKMHGQDKSWDDSRKVLRE